jgi:hypothetical protein
MRWVIKQQDSLWMYAISGTTGSLSVAGPIKLESSIKGSSLTQAAFLTSGALVVSGSGGIELSRLPGEQPSLPVTLAPVASNRLPGVSAIRAAGDGFAVATYSGIQLFSSNGTLRGGAEPLLPGCAVPFTEAIWTTLPSGQLVLGGNSVAYVFRTDGTDGAP